MKQFISVFAIFFCFAQSVFATDLTCPPSEQVKGVQLITATQDQYDPDYWYFTSNFFTHEDRAWQVSFGTFFPEVTSKEEALEQGQAYFNNAAIVIQNPVPVAIPNKTLCNYVPEGREYFISAKT